jgi:hypothetical protein
VEKQNLLNIFIFGVLGQPAYEALVTGVSRTLRLSKAEMN